MNEEKIPIKVGRIPIAVERACKLRLASQVGIYMSDEKVSELATSRPDSYLKAIEEISSITHDPDYVGYIRDESTFVFLKAYKKKGVFMWIGVKVVHEGAPKQWMFRELRRYGAEELKELDAKADFARP
ncbi:MAG: hypothetical protein K6F32_02130 [Bacilli bacterium]|nr:hypothetical protein [Bacilli bacterium]